MYNIVIFILIILIKITDLHCQDYESFSIKADELIKDFDITNALYYSQQATIKAENQFGKNSGKYIESLNRLAICYAYLGETEIADTIYFSCIELCKEVYGINDINYLNSIINITEYLLNYSSLTINDNDIKIRNYLFEAFELFNNYKNDIYTWIRVSYNYGIYQKKTGNMLSADSILINSLFRIKQNNELINSFYIDFLSPIIDIRLKSGKIASADKLLNEELGFFKKQGNDFREIRLQLLNLSYRTHMVMNNFHKASEDINEIISFLTYFQEQNPIYLVSNFNVVDFYIQIGDMVSADYYANNLLYIITNYFGGDKSVFYDHYLNILSEIAINIKDFEKADSLLKKSLYVVDKQFGKTSIEYINTYNNYIVFKMKNGSNFEFEIKNYEKFIKIIEQNYSKFSNYYIQSVLNLILMYSSSYNKYLNESHIFFLLDEIFPLLVSYTQNNFKYLSEYEKILFKQNIDEYLEFLYSYSTDLIYYNKYNHNPLLYGNLLETRLFIKSLVVSSEIKVRNKIIHNNNPELLSLYEKRKALSNKINELSVTNRMKNFDNLLLELENIDKELNFKSQNDQIEYNSLDFNWGDIKKTLNSNEILVEYFNYHKLSKNKIDLTDTVNYAVLLLKKEFAYPKLILLGDEKKIFNLINNSLNNPNNYLNNVKSSNSLYSVIWKPLEQYLNGVNTIYISPSGLLNRVSFYALSNENYELLTDKYNIRYLTNLKDIVMNISEQKVNEISGFNAAVFGGAVFDMDSLSITANSFKFAKEEYTDRGQHGVFEDSLKVNYTYNSVYFSDGKWNYLSGSKEEAVEIANLFHQNNISASIYIGIDASEDAVKSLNFNSSPTVLHIASHGYFFPEPPKDYNKMQFQFTGTTSVFKASDNPLFRSGIILAGANYVWTGNSPIENAEDGILTAHEVSNMDLTNTELVVLSACETGLGDIKGSEGVFGLQRAFKVAGAKSILMSLWKVPDKETAELMNLFYTNWLGGKTKYESLHDAQLEMRKNYDPYYWAAFVLVE